MEFYETEPAVPGRAELVENRNRLDAAQYSHSPGDNLGDQCNYSEAITILTVWGEFEWYDAIVTPMNGTIAQWVRAS